MEKFFTKSAFKQALFCPASLRSKRDSLASDTASSMPATGRFLLPREGLSGGRDWTSLRSNGRQHYALFWYQLQI